MILTGNKEYFKGINAISYEGKDSDNPLAFKYYDPKKVVGGKTMEEHFKFAIAYWHTFCGQGSDPFGPGTLKVFHGINPKIHCKPQKIKQMQHLSLSQKWVLIIFVFMTMI